MKKINLFIAIITIATIFTSCKKDEVKTVSQFADGALVLNEGGFGKGNASVSFLDSETNKVEANVFNTINSRPLGDVLQSAYVGEDYIFMVLNGSGKVEIVNRQDFTTASVIEGVDNPRNITVSGNKAYISQWGENGVVKVIDLNDFSVTSTISAGVGPEGIISSNGKIWTANSGGFDLDNTVSVIDPATDKVVETIIVGDCPKELTEDANGDIWVVCAGYNDYVSINTAAKLVKISSSSMGILSEIKIPNNVHPNHIDISTDRKIVYYGGGFGVGVYALDISATTAPATALIEGSFYGFNVNPVTGDIYTCDAKDYVQAGTLSTYKSSGTIINDYNVGIIPNGVIFVE